MPDRTVQLIIKGRDETGPATQSAKGGLSGLNDAVSELTGVSLTGMGALVALGGALKFSLDEAMGAERQMAATNAVIKSTGGAAGLTAEEVIKLSESEALLTGIQGEVIGAGENMLLTFRNIGGETFPRATRAMQDMAAAMSGGDIASLDLTGTAIQLGKALNDPIEGLTALRRVGVTFSADQEKVIRGFVETNQVAKAQDVILSELEIEFGGMAEAMGNTDAGKIQKAKNAISELAEAIGLKLLPVLGDAAQAFTTLVTWDERVTAVLEQHTAEVAKTSDGYEDYIAEVQRAYAVTNQQVDATGKLTEAYIVDANSGLATVTEKQVALTREQWEAQRAIVAQDGALTDLVATYVGAGQTSYSMMGIEKERAVYFKGLQEQTKAHRAEMVDITNTAITYTAREQERGKVEQELIDLNAEIARQGPVRSVIDQKHVLDANELAAAQAKLTAQQARSVAINEDLATAQKKKGETDSEFNARMAESRARAAELGASMVDLNGKIQGQTIVVGGATKQQLEHRDALKATLDEMQRTVEIEAAKAAFDSLGKALESGKLSESDYLLVTQRLNDEVKLYNDQAFQAATSAVLLNQALSNSTGADMAIAAIMKYGGALGTAVELQRVLITGTDWAGGREEQLALQRGGAGAGNVTNTNTTTVSPTYNVNVPDTAAAAMMQAHMRSEREQAIANGM